MLRVKQRAKLYAVPLPHSPPFYPPTPLRVPMSCHIIVSVHTSKSDADSFQMFTNTYEEVKC